MRAPQHLLRLTRSNFGRRAPQPYERNPRICSTQAWPRSPPHRRVRLSPADRGRLSGRRRRRSHPPAGRQQLGLKQVPVHVAGDLTPAQVRAYAWPTTAQTRRPPGTTSCSSLEIGDLAACEYDLDLLGFEPVELARAAEHPRRPDRPRRGARAAREADHPARRPVDPGPDTACCAAMPPTPAMSSRLMDGKRATLMVTDPPYLCRLRRRQPPADLGQDGRRISSEHKTSHWDDYVDHESSVAFYEDFLRVALDVALGERARHLPVVCHDARRHRHGRLAGGRPAAPPGPHLGQEPAACSAAATFLRLRAAACSAGSRAAGRV